MQDWKDALGALRASVPVDETPDMPAPADDAPARQSLIVLLDKKGRKGKAATIIEGFSLPEQEVDDIARNLRQRLATGGSARGGEILLQGDRRKEAADLLRGMGHKVTVR